MARRTRAERPDANPLLSWAIALRVSPSMRINDLHDATVALRESAAALKVEAEELRAECERLRARYEPQTATPVGQGAA